MRNNDIIRIKNYDEIDKKVKNGPGWDPYMTKHCGRQYRVIRYNEERDEWIHLIQIEEDIGSPYSDVSEFVWDTSWLECNDNIKLFNINDFKI